MLCYQLASEGDDDPILVRAVRRRLGPVRGRLAGRGGGGIRRRVGRPRGAGQPGGGGGRDRGGPGGGGWLVVAAVAFGGESAGRAGRVNLVTGAVVIAVSGLSLVCWSWAWRQRMRADGVLAERFLLVSRRGARGNRRALNRDVRGPAKLAERSARGARRAARRSSRLAS